MAFPLTLRVSVRAGSRALAGIGLAVTVGGCQTAKTVAVAPFIPVLMMADGAGVPSGPKVYVNPRRKMLQTPGVYVFSDPKAASQDTLRLTVAADLGVVFDGFGCHLEGRPDPHPMGYYFGGGGTSVAFAKGYLTTAASGACPAPEATRFYLQGVVDIRGGARPRDFPFGNMVVVQISAPFPFVRANFKPPLNEGGAASATFSRVEARPAKS